MEVITAVPFGSFSFLRLYLGIFLQGASTTSSASTSLIVSGIGLLTIHVADDARESSDDSMDVTCTCFHVSPVAVAGSVENDPGIPITHFI